MLGDISTADCIYTLASRITKRGNSYIAFSDEGEIKFEKDNIRKRLIFRAA